MIPIVAVAAVLCLPAAGQMADLVITNARVYSGVSGAPVATAIAVKDGRIAAMSEMPAARRIDARGATIVPGFIDAHGHMRGLGESMEVLDLRAAASPGEVATQVAAAARARPKGEWIRGRGWDQTGWPGGEFPTGGELTRAAPDHPVLLTRVDGHAGWANQRALALADINAATPDPPGGRLLRDKSGRPTGVLIDRAVGLVSRKIPAPTPAAVRSQLERAATECARLGLTSVHDAGTGPEELAAYRSLLAAGTLPVRIYAMIRGEGALWSEYLARGPEIGPMLTVRSIKLMADGALGSRGAALKKPYSDEPSQSGLMILSAADIERVSRQAVKAGFQVCTHAIGDRANRAVLDAYAAALGGRNDRRFRIEHAQIMDPADFGMFRSFSILPSMQATHATSDMRWAAQRLGERRLEGAYAWRSFLDLGLRVANGSDFPVENANPLEGFYASITRQDAQGFPDGGWRPAERMTREQALRSFTADAAYAAFEEKDKGTLEPGKLADFVLLSRDIMTVPASEVLSTRVVLTVSGGKVVYSAE